LVTPPPVAVTVKVAVRADAVEAADSVKVLLPLPGEAMLAGEKVAVTPAGTPPREKDTAELNAFTRAVVKVMDVVAPAVTLALLAPGVSVKVAGCEIVRLTVWVLVTPPPVAVTVSVEVPADAVEAAVNFKVLLPLPGEAILAGEKLAVTPFGTPLMDRATAELNAFTRAVVKVMDAVAPAVTLALLAPGVSVKLAGCEIVRLRVWVLVTPPPVAIMVRVELPAAADDAGDSVKVLLPFPGEAMLVGEKLADTPAGTPLMEKATTVLNPFTRAVVKVMEVEAPAVTLALLALGVRVKLGGCEIVRLRG
jgi:hypothetical protein